MANVLKTHTGVGECFESDKSGLSGSPSPLQSCALAWIIQRSGFEHLKSRFSCGRCGESSESFSLGPASILLVSGWLFCRLAQKQPHGKWSGAVLGKWSGVLRRSELQYFPLCCCMRMLENFGNVLLSIGRFSVRREGSFQWEPSQVTAADTLLTGRGFFFFKKKHDLGSEFRRYTVPLSLLFLIFRF